jgi:hypothetical protein
LQEDVFISGNQKGLQPSEFDRLLVPKVFDKDTLEKLMKEAVSEENKEGVKADSIAIVEQGSVPS